MFEQKAIAIHSKAGPQAFADALETTLAALGADRWESRIFQFGSEGLLIVAQRGCAREDGSCAMLDETAWEDNAAVDALPDAMDDLAPDTREMLDRIFDLVGQVPLEDALAQMPNAVHDVTLLYPVRFLREAWSDLRRHREQHMIEHDTGGEPCEYAQVVGLVLEAIQAGFRRRLS